jgi:hypothetical protein
VIPAAPVLAALVDLAIALSVLLSLMLGFGRLPRLESLYAVPSRRVIASATALRTAFWLAALNVQYRDVRVLLLLAANQPISPGGAQTHQPGFGLELHLGYGGGGLHRDHLVGGGIGYRFGAHLETMGFVTAVVARPGGRAVFGGLGPCVFPTGGTVRPYLTAGPLLAARAYTRNRIGHFAGGGVEGARSVQAILAGLCGRARHARRRELGPGGRWCALSLSSALRWRGLVTESAPASPLPDEVLMARR